jgi:hypothetical protein
LDLFCDVKIFLPFCSSDCIEKEDLVKKLVEHGAIHDETEAGQPQSEPASGPRPFVEEKIDIAGLPSVLLSNTPAGEHLDLLFVIMHGYGANQFDLVPVGKELLERVSPKSKLKNICFAFPGAPQTIPGYSIGRAWWRTFDSVICPLRKHGFLILYCLFSTQISICKRPCQDSCLERK